MPEIISRRDFCKLGAFSTAGFLAAGNLGENPPIPNALKIFILTNFREIFPTQESRAIKAEVLGLGDDSEDARIVADNLFLIGDKTYLTPNIHFYPDMWTRDVIFSTESKYLKSPLLVNNILTTIESQQAETGQIPTTVAIVGNPPHKYSYDESTFLYLTKIARIARDNPAFLTPERRMHAEKALGFTRRHSEDGAYVTPPGSRRGIVDAFRFPEHDVITYLQGTYAASLLAADALGLRLHRNEIKAAASAYQSLMNNGIASLSRRFDKAVCVGALCGEYIALKDFGQQFLTDQQVSNALENAPGTDFENVNGESYFKILTKSSDDEDFFDPRNFINLSAEGRYQNGAVWLWWDYIAKSVGRLYNLAIVKPDFVSKIQELLKISDYSESIPTGGIFEKIITPEHPSYVWNTAIS